MATNVEQLLIDALNRSVNYHWLTLEDDTYHLYSSEIYCDYRDELSEEQLKRISSSDDPEETLSEILSEMELNYSLYEKFTIEDLELTKEEKEYLNEHEEEASEWLDEHVQFRLPANHFLSQSVKVNLILATSGEANRDFGEYMCLNYYGQYSCELESDNALMWIANQFGQGKQLQDAVRKLKGSEGDYTERSVHTNPFIESTIQELENFNHVMGAVTFLLEMPLIDFIRLNKMQWGKEHGALVIKPDVMCGLFAPWVGGGSVLELTLPTNLYVPDDMIWSAWIDGSKTYGYDPGDVYGLCGSAWKPAYEFIETGKEKTAA